MPKLTARQRKLYQDLATTLARTQMDLAQPILLKGHLPLNWAEISATPDTGHVRVTLRVDKDVAKFYRAIGRGHQATMNAVLRAFMLSRLSEMLPEPSEIEVEDTDPALEDGLAQEARLMKLLEGYRRERLGG